jgi:hypoxanthine-DNA glycosylase
MALPAAASSVIVSAPFIDGMGVGVGLGMTATTLPVAVVLIDPGEFSPTASDEPLHAASTIRLAPAKTVRRIESLPRRQFERHHSAAWAPLNNCLRDAPRYAGGMTLKRSFPPVVDARTRLLICGSLPGERSLAAGRYYAHPQNQFWRLLSPVAQADLQALEYDARLAALLAARIGLWDVVASATRTGSGDAAIRDHAPNALPALAATLPGLRAIAFNGGAAGKIGMRQMNDAGADFALIALPSSSPLHTVGLAAKQPAWAALARYLR